MGAEALARGIDSKGNIITPAQFIESLENDGSIREVTAMNGRFYTLRIAPYRTTENNIRGLVITIIDSLGVKA